MTLLIVFARLKGAVKGENNALLGVGLREKGNSDSQHNAWNELRRQTILGSQHRTVCKWYTSDLLVADHVDVYNNDNIDNIGVVEEISNH
jgi:hypothetical protein